MARGKFELSAEDKMIIEEIAKKYEVSVDELGRHLLARKYPRIQILLTEEELGYVDENAIRMGLSRSAYCYECFKKAVD